LSIVVWIGTISFFSFAAAPSIFKLLPRETAGDVIGDIFPKYWLIGYCASTAAFVTLVAITLSGGTFPAARIVILAVMTILTFYSGLVVGKRARGVKAEIRGTEDEAKKGALRKRFKRLHAESSVLNMAVLVLGIVLIFLVSCEMSRTLH